MFDTKKFKQHIKCSSNQDPRLIEKTRHTT